MKQEKWFNERQEDNIISWKRTLNLKFKENVNAQTNSKKKIQETFLLSFYEWSINVSASQEVTLALLWFSDYLGNLSTDRFLNKVKRCRKFKQVFKIGMIVDKNSL